jgi:predicted PurR-regulated permease PerM
VFGVWGLALALPMLAIAKVVIDFVRHEQVKPAETVIAAS